MNTPYNMAVPVTPSDTVNVGLAAGLRPFDALYIGVPVTNVAVVLEGGTAVTFTFSAAIADVSVNAPFILPVRGIRVNDTNTDSTNIVALYL